MKTKMLTAKVQKEFERNIPASAIYSIILFGSLADTSHNLLSDIDLLIIFDACKYADYLEVIEYRNKLKHRLEKSLNCIVDIFILSKKSSHFILKSVPFFHKDASKYKILFSQEKGYKLPKTEVINFELIKTSAAILFFDLVSNLPNFDNSQRRKNLKKYRWFIRHVDYFESQTDELKRISKRSKNIENEEPFETLSTEIAMLQIATQKYNSLAPINIDAKLYSRVEFAKLYFTDLKRNLSEISADNLSVLSRKNNKEFFEKFLSAMFRLATVYSAQEFLEMENDEEKRLDRMQEIVDKYINPTDIDYTDNITSNYSIDYATILFLCDFLFEELNNAEKEGNN